MTNDADLKLIAQAITDEYIGTGSPVRPDAIARRLTEEMKLAGWSEAKVRRVMNSYGGGAPGCTSVRVEVPRYSKSYKSMQVGVSMAWAYEPSLETLRRLIIASRG